MISHNRCAALREHCIAEVASKRQSIVFYAHLKSANFRSLKHREYFETITNISIMYVAIPRNKHSGGMR